MKKLKLNCIFAGLAILTALASCRKSNVTPNTGGQNVAYQDGLYILNQGSGFSSFNSTLTFYNFAQKALIPDQYSVANKTRIGGVGNDVEIYGSKMYIVATISSVVDVVDPKTTKLIKQDSIIAHNYVIQPPLYSHLREPRSIAFYKGNAFITSFDGTVAVMDTTTLTITKYITVGRYPEGLAVANNKLYVANSGGGLDSTVSVVDLNTLTEIKKIKVIPYPERIAADNYGNVYVMSVMDYGNDYQPVTYGGMTIIDNKTDLVKSQPPINAGFDISATIQGDSLYYSTLDNKIAIYNTKTQTAASDSFIKDGTKITKPYAITISPVTGEVFVTDAKDYLSNGVLYAFDKTGKLEYTLPTGINPGRILLLNK